MTRKVRANARLIVVSSNYPPEESRLAEEALATEDIAERYRNQGLPIENVLVDWTKAHSCTGALGKYGTITSMTISHFSTPREDRYFEDYEAGRVYEFGSVTLTEPEILEFARRYDPQDMHVDPEKALQGRFGGIIASGWQTIGVAMRLYVDHYLSSVASMASPGVDEVRWPNPVRPGDAISIRVAILETIPSRSKADRGVVRARIEAFNQNQQPVLSLVALSIIGRRPS